MSFSQVSECLSCQYGISFEMLLPHLAAVTVEKAEISGDCVWLQARARADSASCPRCGGSSGKVHSTYQRRLADAAIGGRRVRIRLRTRRFFCGNPDCPARTFAEQVSGLTSRRSRRTPPLARTLASVALALAGRAGARLAGALDLTAGRSSVLRLVMAQPDSQAATVTVLGVDDFSLQPLDDLATADFYELTVARHRKSPTIVTSNRTPDEWVTLMSDPLLAQSAADRLTSTSHELIVEG